jgi:hypothetical protein
VRGTTRRRSSLAVIERAGIEPAEADPDRVASVLDQIADVTVIFWLLGSADGAPEAIAAIHGARLERVLEEVVDTPVRGVVYEASGTVEAQRREHGVEVVRAAAERWRIPIETVDADPAEHEAWREAMLAAAGRLTGRTRGDG